MRTLLMVLTLLKPSTGLSTTWRESEVDDPINIGEKCSVSKPGSYGSYIYHWPSKYDQVFWPFIDANNIWFCKHSGYVSFMSDFADLDESEKESISAYLKNHKLEEPSVSELLEALEQIYELRNLTPERRNMLLRVFARWYQRFENIEKANKYRLKALAEIEKSLTTELPESKRLEYLYLAANYARFFNEISKSEEYLVKLDSAISDISDSELTGFGEYLKALSAQTKYIVPGKAIEPELPESDH